MHPRILSRVRQEHDEVFGSTLENTLSTLKEDAHRLNKLPLTLAVFKETLRLFPVGFIVKKGPPGYRSSFTYLNYADKVQAQRSLLKAALTP
jgi:hypothetical protein